MSLFEKIFSRPQINAAQTANTVFKTLTAYEPIFTNWNGAIYESELVRSAIDARARHISKLKVEVIGSANPTLQTKLRLRPNSWQTWSQFLYRASTILDMNNTLVIVLVSVPVTCAFSLWVASVISKLHVAATSAFRCIFYLPVVTGSVAVTMVWKWMYNNYYGIFNYLGNQTGLLDKNINWLGDPKYALGCIILILLTTSVGQPIVLYVSALDNVDKSLVEAAEVDGATQMQAFWKIKWPQMMPTTLYILVITTINSFQCFALIQLLTSGGPSNSTMTIMYYIYYNAFKLYKYGYGNAMGVILAIIIAILSAVQFKLGEEK